VSIDYDSDIADFLARPEFFPLRIDLQRRAVVFVQMSRETLQRSSFLDERAVLAGPATRCVDLAELKERLASRSRGRPAHFILHGAFCGSTLLARHLEDLPHCLVLKEPHLLAQIAKLGNAGPESAPGSREWADWFDVALTLLSRTDADDAAVLIKAPDQCNWLADELLDRDRAAKIIFLCAPLRVFLLSALKSADRREWLRSRGRGLRLQLAQVPFQEPLVVEALTHAQLGAALWLLNNFLCRNLLARPDSERILVMSSEDLIGRPRERFQEAVEFLGLARDEDIRSALGTFRPINYYAKSPDLPGHFDAATRGAALTAIDERFGREVDAAIGWATRMSADWLANCPFPVE
jgi:hypothetical protein